MVGGFGATDVCKVITVIGSRDVALKCELGEGGRTGDLGDVCESSSSSWT